MDKLALYLNYPFVRYAFIVGILIALCSALLGVPLVLKRFSFIGDGLSHVAFGALAVASVFNLTNNMLIVLPLTIISAVFLINNEGKRIKGDAAIAMLSVSALAVGYLIMNLFSTSTNISSDVCSTLFGSTSFLTLDSIQVWLCIVLSVLITIFYVFCYNRLFSVTFDEDFARATGINTRLYNFLFAIVIAIIIVLAMNLVGSLLISALIVFPALSAMRLFNSFLKVSICAAVYAVVCTTVGLIISILIETPVGATIVMTDAVVFFICMAVGRLRRN